MLDYLHSRQPPVIHRDIKPSNILLTDRSGHSTRQIYLIDLGSVQAAVHGGTRITVGTYGYRSPEQFEGKDEECLEVVLPSQGNKYVDILPTLTCTCSAGFPSIIQTDAR
ncbi:hypothetical protein [Okeania sp. KiyG1]|uniref:protein kinase domain-containing protein n=1 Tax=Okeania sp. KiyG1 TaxID=2720165 RepID=UPI0035C883A9